MKPRLRKVEGFWRCTTPDTQGIGATPELAWREYMDQWIEQQQEKSEASRKEYARRDAEFASQMAKLSIRASMAAYGFVMNEDGKVVKDLWADALQAKRPKATPYEPPTLIRLPPPALRWWEFWK